MSRGNLKLISALNPIFFCTDAYPVALHTFLPLGLSSWLKLEQKKRQTTATTAKEFFTSIVQAAAFF